MEILRNFVNRFFSDYKLSEINIKPNLTIAVLQNMVLQGSCVEDIIDFCRA
jgi:hypothetical protein